MYLFLIDLTTKQSVFMEGFFFLYLFIFVYCEVIHHLYMYPKENHDIDASKLCDNKR